MSTHDHAKHVAPTRVDPACEPRLVGVAHTLAHCARVLPPAPARLVEMGAGDGLLAEALAARGYDVLAVDDNAERVEAARARGVNAVCANAVTFTSDTLFDAVLYTRSLHHMAPLDVALDHARAMLRPGGVLLLEEFAWETLDRETARWIVDLFAVCEAGGLVDEPWVDDLMLHTGETLRAAVRERFTLIEVAPVEYLYRYLCWRLTASVAGRRVAQAAFAAEARQVREGHLRGIGLRITARRDG